jgi:hypothetical protein
LPKPEEPKAARHGTGCGKPGADEESQVGASADSARARARQREDQTDQCRSQGLPNEPCAGKNATGAAGAFARRACQDRAVVGRLKKTKTDAAEYHPPGDARGRRVRFLERDQHQSRAQPGQPDPAENPGRIAAIDKPSGNRRGEGDSDRPRGHQQPRLDRGSAKHLLQKERERDEGQVLRCEGTDGADHGECKDRPRKEFHRQHRVGQHVLSPDEESARNSRSRPLEQYGD